MLRVYFPPAPVCHALPAKIQVCTGELICPTPHSTPSRNSRGRAPVKSGDLGALGGGQTGQFCHLRSGDDLSSSASTRASRAYSSRNQTAGAMFASLIFVSTSKVHAFNKGPFINSVTRDRPFFRSRFTPPPPVVTLASRSKFGRK